MTKTKQEMLEWMDEYADLYVAQSTDNVAMIDAIGDFIARAQVVPDGWKLVPIEPTEKMIDVDALSMFAQESIQETYKAMLSLAPKPEEPNNALV